MNLKQFYVVSQHYLFITSIQFTPLSTAVVQEMWYLHIKSFWPNAPAKMFVANKTKELYQYFYAVWPDDFKENIRLRVIRSKIRAII